MTLDLRRLAGMLARAGCVDSAKQIAAIAQEPPTGEPMPALGTRTPRLLTAVIRKLRTIATKLDSIYPATHSENDEIRDAVSDLRAIATDLQSSDARETRPDPRLRAKAKARR